MVRKLLFVVLVVLFAVPALALIPPYTLTPWQYGVIAWVQGEPNTPVLQRVEKAVQDVFSFWQQPLPERAEAWDRLSEMPEDAWAEGNYNPFSAGFVPIPWPDVSKMWAVQLPTWNGEKILPLTLLALANYSQVQSLAGSAAGAAFSPRNMSNSILALNKDPSLPVFMTRSDLIL